MSSLLPLLNDYYEYYRLLNEEDCYYCYEWSGLDLIGILTGQRFTFEDFR